MGQFSRTIAVAVAVAICSFATMTPATAGGTGALGASGGGGSIGGSHIGSSGTFGGVPTVNIPRSSLSAPQLALPRPGVRQPPAPELKWRHPRRAVYFNQPYGGFDCASFAARGGRYVTVMPYGQAPSYCYGYPYADAAGFGLP